MRKKIKSIKFHYEERQGIRQLSDFLLSIYPKKEKEIIFLCIGTDRSTGDALGPLVGTYLKERFLLQNVQVYGTLQNPLHAKNLISTLDHIYKKHQKAFFIAIDASLGNYNSIGTIYCNMGSLQPGAALQRDLPAVGHAHITGVVNVLGFMEASVLQSTRLYVVNCLAEQIAKAIYLFDVKLSHRVTSGNFTNSL